MSRFRRFVTEIHRRSIWQVLGIYLVGSWIAYEVTLAIVDGLGLPDWVAPLAIILFIIFLPIVLATAFVQEGLPGSSAAPAGASPAVDGSSTAQAFGETSPAGTTSHETAARPHPLTWHRASMAGGLAFVVLALSVTGFMGMRTAGVGPFGSLAARGELGADNRVLVAEFEPLTGDSLLARVVAEAFRIDLTQSDLLRSADRSRVQYALDRMSRPQGTRVAGDVAREIALRLGLAVLIEGDVGQAGSGYLLSARLVTADSGRVLVGFRETAKDSTDLLPAVDRLSRRLRERAGESLRTIRSNPPLSRVTTPSLSALRLYMRAEDARRDGDSQLAVQLYKQALALDPEFSAAHRALAVTYRNWGWRNETTLFHLQAAVRQEHRLTESERHHARAVLFWATGRLDEARREYESLIAVDSTDVGALINLGILYDTLRQYERAEEYVRRAMATGFRAMNTTYANVVSFKLQRRDFDGAKQVIEEAAQEHPTSLTPGLIATRVALAEGDFTRVEALIDSIGAGGRSSGAGYRQLLWLYTLLRGQPDRAYAMTQEQPPPDDPVDRAYHELSLAYADLLVLQRPGAAVSRLRTYLRHPALDSLPPADVPYPQAAMVLAAAGESRMARQLIDRFESGIPRELVHWYTPALLAARGFAELAEGRADAAVTLLTQAQQRSVICVACFEALRGQVLEAAGRPDSAAAAYERYIDTGWDQRHLRIYSGSRMPNDPFLLGLSHERAARIYDELGNIEKARRHYASLVRLWENADPVLQPRVAAARARLEALTGERH
jgi:tetratricopeptide (TPR) repeat protein